MKIKMAQKMEDERKVDLFKSLFANNSMSMNRCWRKITELIKVEKLQLADGT